MNNLPSPILYKEEERLDVRLGFKYNCFIKDDNDLIFHTHDYYELLFLPHEGCTHLVNGITYHLPKGSLIFIRPSDCHDFLNPELKPVQIIHLGISHTIIEKLFDYLSPDFPSDKLLLSPMPPYIILDSFETNELLDSLNKLNSVDVKNKSLKAVVMRATLSTVFMQFFSDKKDFSLEKALIPEWLSKTCNEMKKQENFSLGIDRMVEVSEHTKEHLCRSFKKYFGYTAMSYINDLRLTYIANMLIYTSDDIIDICYDSGYTNLSWMYSLFKKKYGISPSKFRKINS